MLRPLSWCYLELEASKKLKEVFHDSNAHLTQRTDSVSQTIQGRSCQLVHKLIAEAVALARLDPFLSPEGGRELLKSCIAKNIRLHSGYRATAVNQS